MHTPLDFLAPLVAIDQAFTAGLAVFANLTLLGAVLAPLVWVLVQQPMTTGAWRAPYGWWLAPLLSMLVCSEALRGGASAGGLGALFVLGAWLTLVLLLTLPRLVFRVLRFLVTGQGAVTAHRFNRAVGALGLVAALVGVLGAFTSGRFGVLGLAAVVAALALLPFRQPAKEAPPKVRSRFVWLAGTVLVAVSTPPLLASAMLLATGARPGSNGVLLMLVSAMVMVLGAPALWLGGSASRPKPPAPPEGLSLSRA